MCFFPCQPKSKQVSVQTFMLGLRRDEQNHAALQKMNFQSPSICLALWDLSHTLHGVHSPWEFLFCRQHTGSVQLTRWVELVMWFMSLEKGFGVVRLVYEFGNEVCSCGVEGGFVLDLQCSGCVRKCIHHCRSLCLAGKTIRKVCKVCKWIEQGDDWEDILANKIFFVCFNK